MAVWFFLTTLRQVRSEAISSHWALSDCFLIRSIDLLLQQQQGILTLIADAPFYLKPNSMLLMMNWSL
jgi:hypothetical protein